jgi:hypothetical protein
MKFAPQKEIPVFYESRQMTVSVSGYMYPYPYAALAYDYLYFVLRDHRPRHANIIIHWAKHNGISYSQLNKAANAIGIKRERRGYGPRSKVFWSWEAGARSKTSQDLSREAASARRGPRTSGA